VETALGILGLAAFIVAVVALAAGVTYVVIKISPSQSAKELQGTGDG
jgi:hypothetical protein